MSEKYLETLELLRKASTDKGACTIDESAEMNDVDVIRTPVPAVNLALNSNLDGGLTSGLTFIAGPSRHFKSNLGLLLVASYLRKYDDATCVFIDTEFGTTPEYLASMGVDPKRTLHIKCESVEKIRSEMAKQLKAIRDYDNARKKDQPRKRVIFFVDSIGNSASSKEVSDAENENSAADMTRAKVLKSLFRVVTPYFKILDIPCVAINHTYQTIEMFSKTVMGGGTGGMYSADTVIILGRQQEKESTEIVGYNFIMNIEKSRFVREKKKIPLNVTFDGGINTYSGLLDIAMAIGWTTVPTKGWYSRAFLDVDTGEMVVEDKKWRRKDTDCVEFWKPLMSNEHFRAAAHRAYAVAAKVNEFEDSDELFDY